MNPKPSKGLQKLERCSLALKFTFKFVLPRCCAVLISIQKGIVAVPDAQIKDSSCQPLLFACVRASFTDIQRQSGLQNQC